MGFRSISCLVALIAAAALDFKFGLTGPDLPVTGPTFEPPGPLPPFKFCFIPALQVQLVSPVTVTVTRGPGPAGRNVQFSAPLRLS